MPSLVKPKSKPIKKSVASRTQQGTDTAKRMRAKLATFKKKGLASEKQKSPKKREADEDLPYYEDNEEAFSVGEEDDGMLRKEDGAITRDLIGDKFNQLADAQKVSADE